MLLGDLLARLRQRRGMTMPEVVEALGIPRSTGYSWEGPHSRPEPENLQRLLDLYEATDEERLQAWDLRARGVSGSDVAA